MTATLDDKILMAAQNAWSQLTALGLLPTPENYAVLFAYAEARDSALVARYNEAIKTSGGDAGRLANALAFIYEQHLSARSKENVVAAAAADLDKEVQQVLGMVATMQSGNQQYGQELNQFGQSIATENSIEQIRAMVTKMALVTKAAQEQNAALQDQLQSSLSQVNELRSNLDNVRKENLQDALTGVGNRKAFTADLVRVTAETEQRGDVLSILMVDIDFFKKFNDKYGHLVGDQVLKLVANTLKENLKGRDSVARWGGEEFAILLPSTPLEAAVRVGDHLRKVVASKKIIRKPSNEDLGVITLSMGATQYVYGEDPNGLVERADGALYAAKQAGRNQVMPAEPAMRSGTFKPITAEQETTTATITVAE